MAWRNVRPFNMVLCCVAGLVVCFHCQNAESQIYHSNRSQPYPAFRTVGYLDADPNTADSALSSDKPQPVETPSFFAPLVTRLEAITKLNNSQARSWANETIAGVQELAHAATGTPAEVRVACDRLDRAVHEAYLLASMKMTDEDANQLRRAGYAIQRRVSICRIVLPLDTKSTDSATVAEPIEQADPKRLDNAIREVETLLATDPAGKTWRDFLMLDELSKLSEINIEDPDGVTQRRAVVRKAIARASDVWLNEQQQAFLQTPKLRELGAALRAEAAGPISRRRLLELLELYEATNRPSVGKQLADETMWLALAENPQRETLRQELTNHYRNANFRVEVAEVLMDRLIPPRTPELAPVRDTVLGNPVRGESLTETEVGIQLLPSDNRLLLAIDVTGEVDASTSSRSGPATFRNRSVSWYHAQKPLEITTDGLKIMPTNVLEVRNSTRLRSLRTSLDDVPIISSLVRDVARSQHDAKKNEMRAEIRRKVMARARNKIETEANERLGKLAKRFDEKVLTPLDHLMLGPTLVQAKTTDDRLVMRVRLASIRQLGAHTTRPKAPSDALLSFQVHESAMNNAIERLQLNGRTFTVAEIRKKLADVLKRPELADTPSKHDDATITFAAEDPIRVRLQEGRLRINLSVAELRRKSKAWKDFEVIVFYKPTSEGRVTYLERDGVVQLDTAEPVSFRSQMTLRGVFCTVFSKNRTIPLVPPKLAEHPKMADLYLSQMTLDSGWLAVALSSREKTIAKQGEPKERR
ncbi:MAG: hypothetical protein PVH19_05340 [Planctomycetia bacterium]|jgi:hypothetical protein